MPAPKDIVPESPQLMAAMGAKGAKGAMGTMTAPAQEPQAGNAVERSLEEFIARANTTLMVTSPEVLPQVRAIAARVRRKPASGPKPGNEQKSPATLVVLGPTRPLAEETEIVTRLSPEDLRPVRRSWFSLRLGLAFAAGAAMVLVATQLISGPGPRPVVPTVPAVVAVPAPVPSMVVEPIPPSELTALAPVAAPAPLVVAAPAPLVVTAPAPPPAPEPHGMGMAAAPAAAPTTIAERPRPATAHPLAHPASRKPRQSTAKATSRDSAKKPSGLVDPFAN